VEAMLKAALATRIGRRVGPAEGGQPKVRVPTAGDSEGHGEGSSRAIALKGWWTQDALPRTRNPGPIRNRLSGCRRVAEMVVVTVWDSDGCFFFFLNQWDLFQNRPFGWS
jgi:hypothetical protein